ncbi:rod shape-determining protein [Nonomuraea sp. NPDC050310]|uniref:rod shape-determining protein n=1 Tax=unclassified Nonomuraea TaxID=2593643 RepID=UPI003402ABFC
MSAVRAAPGGVSFVALDLGTARTRSLCSASPAIADRPSHLPSHLSARPPRSGQALRHGMVADRGSCLELARLVMREARLSGGWPVAHVVAGIPLAASSHDRRAVRESVGAAAGCPVTLIEEPLAAAAGAGLDLADPRPRLLLDVGAGIVEAVTLRGGAIEDATALQLAATTSAGLVSYAQDSVVAMTAALLHRLSGRARATAREAGLVVTGGGAHESALVTRLSTALRMPVRAAPEPQHATIRGLLRLSLTTGLPGTEVSPEGRAR